MGFRAVPQTADERASKELAFIQCQLRRNLLRETALIAFFLGCMCMTSVGLMVHSVVATSSAAEFACGVYVLVVQVLFDMSEFLTAATQRPHDTHPDAFMLLHSWPYMIATAISVVEFAVELCCVPEEWKLSREAHPWLGIAFRLNCTGALVFATVTALFYMIRVTAMLQCGSNFSLIVEPYKRQSHVLVDNGLYRYLRHPAYFGWFWRTLFAQLIVANPVSAVLHTVVTWCFFRRRISSEEYFLSLDDYFGERYEAYRARTYIGIPFVCAKFGRNSQLTACIAKGGGGTGYSSHDEKK